ncbi:MAG: hypothetical protein WCP30_01760 [Mycobacteriaceae bacterium]
MTQSGDGRIARLPSDLPALATVFLLIVGFTFSDDFVEFVLDLTGNYDLAATNRQWLVMALDVLLVLLTAVLKWRIGADRHIPASALLRKILTGHWALGALLVVFGHLALILTAEHRAELGDAASFWISVLASIVFVAAMTMLLLSALSEKQSSRSWIAPLVFGTLVVQIASALWYPVINVTDGCAGEVSSYFFSDMTNMIPVVLLTTAVELNYIRRTATAFDPGRRIAPVFIVLQLCIALGLSLSMVVKADLEPRCGLGAVWHEYISFVVGIQALSIGLAAMVWLNHPGFRTHLLLWEGWHDAKQVRPGGQGQGGPTGSGTSRRLRD